MIHCKLTSPFFIYCTHTTHQTLFLLVLIDFLLGIAFSPTPAAPSWYVSFACERARARLRMTFQYFSSITCTFAVQKKTISSEVVERLLLRRAPEFFFLLNIENNSGCLIAAVMRETVCSIERRKTAWFLIILLWPAQLLCVVDSFYSFDFLRFFFRLLHLLKMPVTITLSWFSHNNLVFGFNRFLLI